MGKCQVEENTEREKYKLSEIKHGDITNYVKEQHKGGKIMKENKTSENKLLKEWSVKRKKIMEGEENVKREKYRGNMYKWNKKLRHNKFKKNNILIGN